MQSHLSPRVLTALVLFIQFILGWVFSVIQPIGRAPDEIAHVQYIAYLSQTLSLPIFVEQGGGIAGYQSQHPPLYYAFGAIFYGLSAGLDEATRWHILRWVTFLFVGGGLFLASRNFFQTLWPMRPFRVLAATASVVWMPLSLLYSGYVNPDGLVALWGAVGLWLCARSFTSETSMKEATLFGVIGGLALLTKLTGFPIVLLAVFSIARGQKSERKKKIAACLSAVLVLALPWYARNLVLYGSPFVHTAGKYGTGFENGARSGFETFAWLTWRETFLSTWAQRGWFPDGFWSWALYPLICSSVIGALALGLWARRQNRLENRAILGAGALLIALVFAGQQWAFWTVDVEFNAGGRYLLLALPAIIALLFTGWWSIPKLGSTWTMVWLSGILAMNLVSAQHIIDVLNPRYAPGWKMFGFPPGEERNFEFKAR